MGTACKGEGALRGLRAGVREEVSWAWRGSLGQCGKGKEWDCVGPKWGEEVGQPGFGLGPVGFSGFSYGLSFSYLFSFSNLLKLFEFK